MAEVATGVLHNVGNVLNSVNVSAGLVVEKISRRKFPKSPRPRELLTKRNGDLVNYLTNDPKGRNCPLFSPSCGAFLEEENAASARGRSARSQDRAHQGNRGHAAKLRQGERAFENLRVEQLVEDAIAMNMGAFERHGVTVERDFASVPVVCVDRHKVLQILINLIRNAKYALDDSKRQDKRFTSRIAARSKRFASSYGQWRRHFAGESHPYFRARIHHQKRRPRFWTAQRREGRERNGRLTHRPKRRRGARRHLHPRTSGRTDSGHPYEPNHISRRPEQFPDSRH